MPQVPGADAGSKGRGCKGAHRPDGQVSGNRLRLLRSAAVTHEMISRGSNFFYLRYTRPLSQTPGELRGLHDRGLYLLSIAEDALKDVPLTESDKPGFRRYIRRIPFGVAFLIVPWK